MNRKLLSCLIGILLIGLLSGCGKAKLETGDIVSDASVLSNGAFICDVIDTSYIPGNFNVYGLHTTESDYSYLLSCYNYSTYSDNLYFIKFDKSGAVLKSGPLDEPVYKKDDSVFYSDLIPRDSVSSGYTDCVISYTGLTFDNTGALSGYCEVYGYIYHEEDNTQSDYIENYYIKWDKDGNCISAEVCDEVDYSSYVFDGTMTDKSGKIYRAGSSGISVFDSDKKYINSYFDFINSDIYSVGFDSFTVIDENSFSGVFTDLNGNTLLGCFNRKTGSSSGDKALTLACSGITDKIREDVYMFNSDHNGYRFAIVDYSDRNFECNTSEGWTDLKNDLIAGYDPDIVLNTSGYDNAFLSKMVQNNRFCNLKDVIKKDKELKGFEISDKAKSLFYTGADIYSVIPSYSYRTIVGSGDYFGQDQSWDEYKLMSILEPVADEHVIFFGETRDSFLSKILDFNGYTYVDFNAKAADFDNEGFIDYLELAAHLSADVDEASEKQYSAVNLGQTILLDNLGYCLGDMHLEYSNYSKGAYYDLGIPAGVNNGSGVYVASMSFMISSGHAYTNECWDFIKKYLTEEYQEKIEYAIPVSASAYDIWLNDTSPRSNNQYLYSYVKDDVEYYVWPAEAAEADYLKNNLNNCRRTEFKDYAVEQIVLEYAHQYFDGKITSQEAAKSIDQAVESYLQTA